MLYMSMMLLRAKSFLIPLRSELYFCENTQLELVSRKALAGSLTLGDFLKQANIACSPKFKDVLKKQYECKK